MEDRIERVFEDVLRQHPSIGDRLREERPRARIAGALTRVRNALGLTQRDIASRMDTPQSNVARLEKASGNPQTTEAILAYAKACGLTLGLVFMRPEKQTFAIVEATAIDDDGRCDEYLRALTIAPQTRAQPRRPAAAAAAAAVG